MVPFLQARHAHLPTRRDRVERQRFDVRFLLQRLNERIDSTEHFLVRVERIGHESDLDAGAGTLDELDDEPLGEIAWSDDVELDVDGRARLIERVE